MEYADPSGYFEHPSRKAIFLGDFIDRGINQAAVLDIVMPMVANGAALAVMGNHEFNALAFHTLHPSRPSTWLRERNNKNISQHLAFLNDYSSPAKADQLQQVLREYGRDARDGCTVNYGRNPIDQERRVSGCLGCGLGAAVCHDHHLSDDVAGAGPVC